MTPAEKLTSLIEYRIGRTHQVQPLVNDLIEAGVSFHNQGFQTEAVERFRWTPKGMIRAPEDGEFVRASDFKETVTPVAKAEEAVIIGSAIEATVRSEPSVDQYRDFVGLLDDDSDDDFAHLAWDENDEATSVDHGHAAGFYLGFVAANALLNRNAHTLPTVSARWYRVRIGDEYVLHDSRWDDGNIVTMALSRASKFTKERAEEIARENDGVVEEVQ